MARMKKTKLQGVETFTTLQPKSLAMMTFFISVNTINCVCALTSQDLNNFDIYLMTLRKQSRKQSIQPKRNHCSRDILRESFGAPLGNINTVTEDESRTILSKGIESNIKEALIYL